MVVIRNKSRKAQVATEFMLVVGFAMVIIILFAGSIYYLSYKYSEERNENGLRDLGYSLQSELILASEVEPGYKRVVEIPDQVNGVDYSISQSPNDLVITYKGNDLVFPIPLVTGSLQKGTNIIRKTDANTVEIS